MKPPNSIPPTIPFENKFSQFKEFDLSPNFFRQLFKVDPFHIDKVKKPFHQSSNVLVTSGDLNFLALKLFVHKNSGSQNYMKSQFQKLSKQRLGDIGQRLLWLR